MGSVRNHKTVLNEFYRVAFPKKVYRSIDELQADLDAWIKNIMTCGPSRRWCFGKTPMPTFLDGNADGEGENDRSLTSRTAATDRSNQAQAVRSSCG
jgi:hypothetical protein